MPPSTEHLWHGERSGVSSVRTLGPHDLAFFRAECAASGCAPGALSVVCAGGIFCAAFRAVAGSTLLLAERECPVPSQRSSGDLASGSPPERRHPVIVGRAWAYGRVSRSAAALLRSLVYRLRLDQPDQLSANVGGAHVCQRWPSAKPGRAIAGFHRHARHAMGSALGACRTAFSR